MQEGKKAGPPARLLPCCPSLPCGAAALSCNCPLTHSLQRWVAPYPRAPCLPARLLPHPAVLLPWPAAALCPTHLSAGLRLLTPACYGCLSAEAKKAVEQLTLAARVLAFALHAANKPLLQDCGGPLSVVGTISVAAQGRKLARFEGARVGVSCAALPATEGATMLLRTQYLKR